MPQLHTELVIFYHWLHSVIDFGAPNGWKPGQVRHQIDLIEQAIELAEMEYDLPYSYIP